MRLWITQQERRLKWGLLTQDGLTKRVECLIVSFYSFTHVIRRRAVKKVSVGEIQDGQTE